MLRKLERDNCENDAEIGLMKIRYDVRKKEKRKLETDVEYEGANGKKRKIDCETYEEKDEIEDAIERQVYDPVKKVFDYSKKRTTDLQENV